MLKKIFFFVVLMGFSFSAFSGNLNLAEKRAMSVPNAKTKNMMVLTHFLSQNLSQEEQVKSIAVWIAAHIKYDNYTFAADVKNSGFKARPGLKANGQTAQDVFNTGIATCMGYADLYEKMLALAHIKSEKVYGYVVLQQSSLSAAKQQVKKESVGHVWNKVYINQNQPVFVDVTFMARGRAGDPRKALSESMKRKEIHQAKKFKTTYPYEMKYFDFHYADMQKVGEYRFSLNRKIYQ